MRLLAHDFVFPLNNVFVHPIETRESLAQLELWNANPPIREPITGAITCSTIKLTQLRDRHVPAVE
jgi:hypothetical protein